MLSRQRARRGLKYGLPLLLLIIYAVPTWRYAVFGPSTEATVLLDDGQTTLSYQLQFHFASEPTGYLVLAHGPWPWQQVVRKTSTWYSAGGALYRTEPGKYVFDYSIGRAGIDVTARNFGGVRCDISLPDAELAGRFDHGKSGPFGAVEFKPAKPGERMTLYKRECTD